MSSALVLRLFFVVSILAHYGACQNSVLTFNWKFKSDANPQKVPICHEFPITVIPNPANATAGNYSGTPPYYMIAFAEGGQPITQHIGDTNDTLSWTPTHPVGTNFALHLMDANGDTGGGGGQVYEVVENPQGQDCVAPSPPNDFTITSNITGDGRIETCHPWRLNVNGGNPPYVVVLNAKDSPVMTNISVAEGNNAVLYINRADPDTTLFASAVDKNGRWARGTQFVSTFGSTDFSCIGFGTVVTTQEELDNAEKALEESRKSTNHTAIIVGVVVSVVGVLLICGIGFWMYRRYRIAEKLKSDFEPRQFMDSRFSGHSVTRFLSPSPNLTPSPRKKAFSAIGPLPYAVEPFTDDRREPAADQARPHAHMASGSGVDLHNPLNFAQFPVSSNRRSGKMRETGQEPLISNDGTTRNQMPSSSALQQQHNSFISPMDNEIIYQHRDAGQVVRELPPPYISPQLQENPDDERRRMMDGLL